MTTKKVWLKDRERLATSGETDDSRERLHVWEGLATYSRETSQLQKTMTKNTPIINQWKRRKLSPLGKITVIKTFILSSFNHIFTSLPAPSTFLIKTLNNLVYSFIWDNKPDKINRKQITNSYLHGGLKWLILVFL